MGSGTLTGDRSSCIRVVRGGRFISIFTFTTHAACYILVLISVSNMVLNDDNIEPKQTKGSKKMPTSTEIGHTGERYVVEWLKANRWVVDKWDTQAPGSTDIEAHSGSKKILVQVKSAVSPNEPQDPSGEETRNIKSRATKLNAEAWWAKVTLNSNLSLKSEIKWKNFD